MLCLKDQTGAAASMLSDGLLGCWPGFDIGAYLGRVEDDDVARMGPSASTYPDRALIVPGKPFTRIRIIKKGGNGAGTT